MKEDISISSEKATALFRIFQETLTNVARHAKATKATKAKISLIQKNDRLEMRVVDNGTGIQNNQLSQPKSFGIMGMQERVNFMQGDIKIEGKKGKGTMVEVKIPL